MPFIIQYKRVPIIPRYRVTITFDNGLTEEQEVDAIDLFGLYIGSGLEMPAQLFKWENAHLERCASS